ncbi:hypothetical protein [Legionella londiniensis]|uniref:HTH cro/C1-type domain-containing protein n=1 Tax=Legionella londiniensis TaxID=45068 RepID=A0A0W0VLR9_9GAMM|nr:hypothetical protein [Legionella londiniensis]KTD21044.1 hypothetical protein Llon_1142 [Legionella londiniensis]STX93681.1 Uncharacterised protein [Legionella londiniensis]
MGNKQFAERLNKELDDMGVPQRRDERIEIFSKLIKVPRYKAEAILNGYTNLEPALLDQLAEELEVSPQWLLGQSDRRQG